MLQIAANILDIKCEKVSYPFNCLLEPKEISYYCPKKLQIQN